MHYFLVKADPDTDYSIQDLARDGETPWEGVHNFQALATIKTMRPGDRVLIYHSQKQKALVGVGEVSSEPYNDEKDPRTSWAVRIKYVQTFAEPLSLAEFKNEPSVQDFLLIRNGRLSVMPVPDNVLAWLRSRLPAEKL